ncbi:MAG: chromosome segregation SMC family protein, partial [Candidatus Nitrosocaldus sp.]
MVYIRKVEISGFKSFARKSTILNLDRGLVCITGPNGSGKSNILDAIAFAIGENSVRVLRVDRLQSLIHDSNGKSVREEDEMYGDEEKKEVSEVEGGREKEDNEIVEIKDKAGKRRAVRVSITFDNSDRRIPLDSNTVTIAREMYENGENQYYLNGKHVNKSTITNMLDVALATPNKLNIVQQGMVMRIAELNPEERRRVIEEIIGLSYFDEKKEEAMKQLEEADRRLEVALARMGEIRSRIDELEQERNDQLRLEFLAMEMERLKHIQMRSMLKHTVERLAALESIIKQKREEAESISKSIEDLRSRITELEDERSKFIRQVEESSKAKAEISRQLSSMIMRIEQLRAMLNANQNRILAIGKSIPMLIREKDDLLTRVKAVEQEVNGLKDALDRLMEEKRKVEEELSNVNNKLSMLSKDYSSKREEEKSVEDEVKRLVDGYSNIELKIASLEERTKVSSESVMALQKRNEKMLEEVSNLNLLLSRLSSRRAEHASELNRLNDAMEKAQARRKRLIKQVDGASSILERAEYVTTRYQAEMDVVMQGEDGTIARLMESKDINRFGIVGMLQSLITWDARYARAVMAVGSNWLKALIVRDVRSMLSILEHVRSSGLTKVTMIPLDMVEGCEEIKSIRLKRRVGSSSNDGIKSADVNDSYREETGGAATNINTDNADRAAGTEGKANSMSNYEHILRPLSHFITSRYRGIVNFIFGDTILAYSRDDAVSLARRGYRAVTIDGELFEPSMKAAILDINTRVGDIIRMIARSRSVRELRDAISLLKQAIERRREEVKSIDAMIQDIEEKRRELIANIAKIDAEVEQVKGTSARGEQMIKDNNDRIGRLREEMLVMQEQINTLVSERSAIEGKIHALKERIGALSKDKDGLEKAMEEMNDMKSLFTSKLEHIDRERRSVMSSISAKNSDRDAMLRRIEDIRKGLEQAKADARESAQTVKRCRDELNRLTEELRVMRDKEQEVIDASSSSLARLQRYDEELRSLISDEKRLNKQLFMLERELVLYNKEYSDLKSKKEGLIKELNNGHDDEDDGSSGGDDDYDGSDINNILKGLEEEYNMFKSNVNQLANRSYMQLIDGYRGMSEKKNQLEEERNAIVRFIEQIEGEKRQLFIDAFSRVDREVRSIFATMTDSAGAAWLEMDDADGDDIFSSGLTFVVQFPNKPARESNSLSGGEKTIAAITFLLALQSLKPAPFYLFDEIDAHLDSVNTERLKKIIRERANISQIIMVTLKDVLVASA